MKTLIWGMSIFATSVVLCSTGEKLPMNEQLAEEIKRDDD
jgi:hypothetical protein